MSQVSLLPFSTVIRNLSRSIGLKLVLVSGLALLMMIPAFFVSDLVDERAKRAKDVIAEISGRTGGEQTFLGPRSQFLTRSRPLIKTRHSRAGPMSCFRRQAMRT